MSTTEDRLAKLRKLQAEADAIRDELGISAPGALIYQAWRNAVDDEMVVVEADGFGRATLKVIEGNYPVDYFTTLEQVFETEGEATEAGDRITADSLT